MNIKMPLITTLTLVLAIPSFAGDKKKHSDRGLLEKMEAVPCGAKESGITGLGSVFASAGIEHVNSDEKLCPQYLLRTDDMEYHIRPLDHKHPIILPIGKEGEFKISKDILQMRIPDGDHKMRHYQVVAIKPIDHSETSGTAEDAKYDSSRVDRTDKPVADKNYSDKTVVKNPDKPGSPPQ
jgi:hypothetical protein